jgi:drug/metabolite transporter (DMT)-like permease
MSQSRETFGFLLGLVGMMMFAGTLPATRLAVGSIDPLFLTAARTTIAGCAGVATLLVTRRTLPVHAKWREFVVTGLCTIVGFPVLMALAMTTVPASHGGVVLGILPLATTAAAALIANERPSVGFWLASAAGAAVVVAFVLSRGGGGFSLGDLFLVGTVIAGSLGYTLSGWLSMRMPGWEVISWQVALFLPLSVVAAVLLWPDNLASVPWPAWAGLAYVALVSQFLSFFVFNAAMALGGVARIGQVMLLQPFVIVALAWPVDGEPIQFSTMAYAAAVVLLVVIGQRMRVRRG